MWRQYNWVRRRGLDRDCSNGLSYQYCFVQNYVACVSNCVMPISSVGNCVWITYKIALCVTHVALFNLYPVPFIVKLLILLTNLSNLSSPNFLFVN